MVRIAQLRLSIRKHEIEQDSSYLVSKSPTGSPNRTLLSAQNPGRLPCRAYWQRDKLLCVELIQKYRDSMPYTNK
jgi:hypothetical protein